jgi:hypothetical protein
MHKISKVKHDYTIITWKELYQYPMNELVPMELLEIVFCQREIHPKKLLELFCTLF